MYHVYYSKLNFILLALIHYHHDCLPVTTSPCLLTANGRQARVFQWWVRGSKLSTLRSTTLSSSPPTAIITSCIPEIISRQNIQLPFELWNNNDLQKWLSFSYFSKITWYLSLFYQFKYRIWHATNLSLEYKMYILYFMSVYPKYVSKL